MFKDKFIEAAKGLPIDEVCRELKISRTTYFRWAKGKSAPYGLAQDLVFKKLESIAGLAGSQS